MSNAIATRHWRRVALVAAVLLGTAAVHADSASADTKEVTCSSQWCKITCNTVTADAHCEGTSNNLASCTCRGEKNGGATNVKCTTGETCDKQCGAGTRPGGNCNMGKPQCVCTDVRN
jgi:hypothetical protein